MCSFSHQRLSDLSQRCLRVILLGAFLHCSSLLLAGQTAGFPDRIATLIAPEKLVTLKPGAANQRLQKAVALLEKARIAGESVERTAQLAVARAGYTNREAATLTAQSLTRNHEIARKLGCLTASGLSEMRRGHSPTITLGPYMDQELSVDHIIPKALVPELDRVVANLELLPLRVNQRKSDLVGDRQLSLARKLHEARLLSRVGLMRVEATVKRK